jgi:hypothetical protein
MTVDCSDCQNLRVVARTAVVPSSLRSVISNGSDHWNAELTSLTYYRLQIRKVTRDAQ